MTVNVTQWGDRILQLVDTTRADVLFFQEHMLHRDRLAAVKRSLARRG